MARGSTLRPPLATDEPAANSTDRAAISDTHFAEIDEATRRRSFWQRWGVMFMRAGLIAAVLGIWWLVARLEIWPRVFVPTPLSVWDKLIQTSTVHGGIRGYSGWFLWEHVWASMRRILLGSGIAIVVGVPLGLLLGSSRWMRAAFSPGITFVRSLPPLAYFSLLVIWFGIDERPKVILLLLAALPPVILATADAVRNVQQDRLLALHTLGASRLQVIRHGVFPSVLPEVITGIRVAVGFAFTTVVAAETINGMPGIGGMVRDAQRFNQTDVVILGILVIGLCGLLLDGAIQLVDRLLVPWRGQL
ncbi:MAG: ABC transporter permease [Gaiellaceae bacterium]